MTSVPTDPALHQFAFERDHFSSADKKFLISWRQAVLLAGPNLFGTDTRGDMAVAVRLDEMRPNLSRIDGAIDEMPRDRKVFLAALVSLCQPHEGDRLFRRIGADGLSVATLDLQRRAIVASLIMHYTHPW